MALRAPSATEFVFSAENPRTVCVGGCESQSFREEGRALQHLCFHVSRRCGYPVLSSAALDPDDGFGLVTSNQVN